MHACASKQRWSANLMPSNMSTDIEHFYLPCTRHSLCTPPHHAPAHTLYAHNFCLRCTISSACTAHLVRLLTRCLPTGKKGSKFKCNEQKSMQPQSISSVSRPAQTAHPLAQSSPVQTGVKFICPLSVAGCRLPAGIGWGVPHACVGVNRRQVALLDCCK